MTCSEFRAARSVVDDDEARRRAGDRGFTLFCWQGPVGAPRGFAWECPGCGHAVHGNVGTVAVGGWDAPVWVNTGTLLRPTLNPSLSCPLWQTGTCAGGHWWLRQGVMVPA